MSKRDTATGKELDDLRDLADKARVYVELEKHQRRLEADHSVGQDVVWQHYGWLTEAHKALQESVATQTNGSNDFCSGCYDRGHPRGVA